LAASTLMLQGLSVADNRLFASAVGQAVTLFVGIIAMRIYEPQAGLVA
jgi:hypothetical protein